jgi:hypothetical protein
MHQVITRKSFDTKDHGTLFLVCKDLEDFGKTPNSTIIAKHDIVQFNESFTGKRVEVGFVIPELDRVQSSTYHSVVLTPNRSNIEFTQRGLKDFCDDDVPFEFYACRGKDIKRIYPALREESKGVLYLEVSAHDLYNDLPDNIDDLAKVIGEWSTKNFKLRENYLLNKQNLPSGYRALFPFLGVGEELLGELTSELGISNIYSLIGEFLHNSLKYQQGIRGVAETDVLRSAMKLHGELSEHLREKVTNNKSPKERADLLTAFAPPGSVKKLDFSGKNPQDCLADGLVFYLDGVSRSGTKDITRLLRKTLYDVLQRDWNKKRNTFKLDENYTGLIRIMYPDNSCHYLYNSMNRPCGTIEGAETYEIAKDIPYSIFNEDCNNQIGEILSCRVIQDGVLTIEYTCY